MKPQRIQRKRTKGWRLPPDTVCVSRPGKWGNPFKVVRHPAGFWEVLNSDGQVVDSCTYQDGAISTALEYYKEWLDEWIANGAPIHELRGKNLACFCKIGEPCHADVLLEVAR